MLVYQFAKLVLAAATLFGSSVVAQTGCVNPSVRREWRSMPPQERAEWIDAVKVGVWEQRVSHVTDDSTSSVSTPYLTTLLWPRPTIPPTP